MLALGKYDCECGARYMGMVEYESSQCRRFHTHHLASSAANVGKVVFRFTIGRIVVIFALKAKLGGKI